LQNAANKYGVDSLIFSVILICATKDLLMYEDICMKAYRPRYNSLKFARRRDGWSPSEETRQKMSLSAKARERGPRPEWVGQKIGAALKAKGIKPPGNLGKQHSPETRAKIAAKAATRTEHLELMRLTRVGHKKSPETLEKIRTAMTGRKQSEETKRKKSMSLTGRKMSEETRLKISLSKTGKKLPPRKPGHTEKIVASRMAKKAAQIES
jgi:hypothetical protein